MKTEVTKQYNWGFLLSEQELRRIAQTCQDHMLKQMSVDAYQAFISVKLKDGSIIESGKVDDIVSLENLGFKQIERLTITYDNNRENSDWSILVRFQDGFKNPTNWTSVDFTVVGQSRDWAFLAASELEERLKKIKIYSSEYIVRNRWFYIFPLLIGTALYFSLLSLFPGSEKAVTELELAYKNGVIKDPIEAIIFLEKAKQASFSYFRVFTIFALGFGLPITVSWVLSKIIPIMSPSYNFYWGDYISYYEKRKSAWNIFWIVIVLGIIVSVISAYIMRFLP